MIVQTNWIVACQVTKSMHLPCTTLHLHRCTNLAQTSTISSQKSWSKFIFQIIFVIRNNYSWRCCITSCTNIHDFFVKILDQIYLQIIFEDTISWTNIHHLFAKILDQIYLQIIFIIRDNYSQRCYTSLFAQAFTISSQKSSIIFIIRDNYS